MKEAMVHLEQYEVVPAPASSNRSLCRNVGVRSEQITAAMNAKDVAQYA
jgi:hypothetical protein